MNISLLDHNPLTLPSNVGLTVNPDEVYVSCVMMKYIM